MREAMERPNISVEELESAYVDDASLVTEVSYNIGEDLDVEAPEGWEYSIPATMGTTPKAPSVPKGKEKGYEITPEAARLNLQLTQLKAPPSKKLIFTARDSSGGTNSSSSSCD